MHALDEHNPLQYIGLAEDMVLILFLLCILATLVKVHLENWATCYRQFQVQNYKKLCGSSFQLTQKKLLQVNIQSSSNTSPQIVAEG